MWKQGSKIIDTGVISVTTQDGREIELSNKCTDLIVENNVEKFADYQLNCSVETTCEASHFIGVDLSSSKDVTTVTLTGYVWVTVQARTHKKKRINKKWLKKYGVKDIRVKKTYVSDGVTIHGDDMNEFGENYKVEMNNVKEV